MDLNHTMDFDHVVRVDSEGRVTDAGNEVYGPNLFEGELDTEGWELLDGYSGQDRYSGPIMHNSEFIGGQMERDILARPGLYVALVCYWDVEEGEDDVEGWAVAYREEKA